MGRHAKIDQFADIINIKWLFRNPEFDGKQTTKMWKTEHHDHVIKYHHKYNLAHKDKQAGYCETCKKDTSNMSQHRATKRHLNALIF